MRTAKPRLIVFMAFIVVLASATLVDPAGTSVVLAQRAVQVPDVVGLSQDRADAAIERAGLVVGAVRTIADQAPKGTVVSQSPPGGTRVAGGSRVSYVVSTGAPAPTATPRRGRSPGPSPSQRLVVVPDVRGLAEADAVARIRKAGLLVTARQRGNNANIASGRAVRTKPAGGTSLAAGSGIVLLISRGPRLVTVPALVGRPQGNARRAIVGVGLVAGEVTSRASSEPKNTVLDQDPAPGTRVRPGSAVSFTVSAGPPTTLVPDVRGLSDAEAIALIEEAGLLVSGTITNPDASIDPGAATGTDPGSGSQVVVGSEVILALSAGVDVEPGGGSPDGTLLVGLVTLIILAGIAGVGATRLARGQRRAHESSAPLPSIRTVSHPDRLPRIKIRGGGR